MSEFTFNGRGILKRIERFTTNAGKEILTLVFEQGGQYPQIIPIKVFGAMAGRAVDWVPGCELAVTGRLGGREWNGKTYGDAVATTVELVGEEKPVNEGATAADDDSVPF